MRRMISCIAVCITALGVGYGGAYVYENNRHHREISEIVQRYETMCPQEDSCDYIDNRWIPVEH